MPYNLQSTPIFGDLNPLDNPKAASNFAMFYCHKERTCTPGGNKVCAYDEWKAHLAHFEDMCTYYKANCKKEGFYFIVENEICVAQETYDLTLNMTRSKAEEKSDEESSAPTTTTVALKEALRDLPDWVSLVLGEGLDSYYKEMIPKMKLVPTEEKI